MPESVDARSLLCSGELSESSLAIQICELSSEVGERERKKESDIEAGKGGDRGWVGDSNAHGSPRGKYLPTYIPVLLIRTTSRKSKDYSQLFVVEIRRGTEVAVLVYESEKQKS